MNVEELIQEARKLIGRWDNLRIVGQGWSGDARRGFQFNPARTVPISTPISCPTTLTVTFHDVIFDCGCVLYTAGSVELTDVGLFNESPIELTIDTPDPACDKCVYFWSAGDVQLHAKIYLGDDDCITLTNEDDFGFAGNIELWLDVANLWHLRLNFFSNHPIVFYGTSTSLSSNFVNQLTCSHDTVTYPDIDCSTFDGALASHGGYATIA